MGNSFGNIFRFTIFGQSHAPAIGVTVEGLPAGEKIDFEALQSFLKRRAPGGKYSTSRKEADAPEFISGIKGDGISCGSPISAIIRNTDTRSGDYSNLKYVPRPGHADFAAMVKYGEGRDYAGGGQFSGRMTAPLCIAGGIALQMLEKEGIKISSRIVSIGGETDEEKMFALIDSARAEGDSLGGIIECVAEGVPPGIGEPMFGGLENRISQAVFGIPAVKGIEFGAGMAVGAMRGSENNDEFCFENGKVKTIGNNHGGILGGISSGMPIVFRAAVKPTPSIAKVQRSVDMLKGENTVLEIKGRHDPCIVPRALPCMEAAMAVALYDALLEAKPGGLQNGH
ncbi:MAG: chorismate synthase [Ruminococcaceae bacterium]|nr:chorismate synthase [Oscillospiraceae bacterium]